MKIMIRRRAQLQISETLISISLLLVLSVLIISIANQALQAEPYESNLDDIGSNILENADELNILRPAIYYYGNSENQEIYQDSILSLESYIDSYIPSSMDYAIFIHQIINKSISDDYFQLLGESTDIINLNHANGVTVIPYYVMNFVSEDYSFFENAYLVKLFIWEKF